MPGPAGRDGPVGSSGAVMAPPDDFAEIAREAAAKREKVVEEDSMRCWLDEPLKPWSEERQRLLDALCAADIPMPQLGDTDDVTFYMGRFPWAVKVLYLATHEPDDWEPHRARLLRVIHVWGLSDYVPGHLSPEELKTYKPTRVNVPGDDIAQKAEAVNFAWRLTQAYRDVQALRRPSKSSGRADSGN